jgi:hypothetical protein
MILIYSLLAIIRELQLFNNIQKKYRCCQNKLFRIDQSRWKLFPPFYLRVGFLLFVLGAVALLHVIVGYKLYGNQNQSQNISSSFKEYVQEREKLDKKLVEEINDIVTP